MGHIKSLLFSCRESYAANYHARISEKIACVLLRKYGMQVMPCTIRSELENSCIRILFSNKAENCYKIVFKGDIVDVVMTLVDVDDKSKEVQRFAELIACKLPIRSKLKRGKFYLCLRLKLEKEDIKCGDIFKFKDSYELIAEHVMLMMTETLPFLIANNFIEQKDVAYWTPATNELHDVRESTKKYKSRISKMKQKLDDAENQILELRSSTSWKITRPLRALKNLFKGR